MYLFQQYAQSDWAHSPVWPIDPSSVRSLIQPFFFAVLKNISYCRKWKRENLVHVKQLIKIGEDAAIDGENSQSRHFAHSHQLTLFFVGLKIKIRDVFFSSSFCLIFDYEICVRDCKLTMPTHIEPMTYNRWAPGHCNVYDRIFKRIINEKRK